jgi:hypothetical protein
MVVCHSCDVRACCNPDHLWLGTQSDNIKDAIAKGRAVGPPLTTLHGEDNPRVKLTETQVREIRALWDAHGHKGSGRGPRYEGRVTVSELASRFGVSRSKIHQIVKRQCWTHLD